MMNKEKRTRNKRKETDSIKEKTAERQRDEEVAINKHTIKLSNAGKRKQKGDIKCFGCGRVVLAHYAEKPHMIDIDRGMKCPRCGRTLSVDNITAYTEGALG